MAQKRRSSVWVPVWVPQSGSRAGANIHTAFPASLLGVSRYNGSVRFRIRQFEQADFETLWRIDQSCFDPQLAYSRPELAFYIRRPGAFTLVAEADDADSKTAGNGTKILGFIVAESRRKNGHIITIDVIAEGLPSPVAAGPLPEGLEPGFILAVGTVEPRKNYPRLLAAFRQLRGRQGSLPFIINGRPGVPQLVIAGRPGWAHGDTLQRIGAEPGVRYLGHVDEPTLSALYESASVLAFPSLYEGFGLPLLEAMSRGVPAVVGAAGALPELALGSAITVEPEDVDAIAGGLERLLSDSQLRQKLGDEGRRRARDFTWDKAAEQTLAVLRRIGTAIHRKVA